MAAGADPVLANGVWERAAVDLASEHAFSAACVAGVGGSEELAGPVVPDRHGPVLLEDLHAAVRLVVLKGAFESKAAALDEDALLEVAVLKLAVVFFRPVVFVLVVEDALSVCPTVLEVALVCTVFHIEQAVAPLLDTIFEGSFVVVRVCLKIAPTVGLAVPARSCVLVYFFGFSALGHAGYAGHDGEMVLSK